MANPIIDTLLVAGDFHGDVNHAGYIYQMADNKRADAIVQVGDLGIWPGAEDLLFEWLENRYQNFGIPFYFIDGNHENFDWLQANDLFDADEIVSVVDGVNYIPRGARWEWNGTKFLGLGGAFSIDKAQRTIGQSWWPQETITWAQVDRILENPDTVDVMFTHDAPIRPPIEYNGYKDDNSSNQNMAAVCAVVDHVQPKVLVHGHWHFNYHFAYTSEAGNTTGVTGLGMNGEGKDSWATMILPLGGSE